MDGLGNLDFTPTSLKQLNHVLPINLMRREIHFSRKVEQRLLSSRESTGAKVSSLERSEGLRIASMYAKKEAVTVCAVRARVLRGDQCRDHLLVLPSQCAFRKDLAL